MKTATLVCLMILLGGCGKTAVDTERENSDAGMKVLAKRQQALRDADKKYLTDAPIPRDGTSSKEPQAQK